MISAQTHRIGSGPPHQGAAQYGTATLVEPTLRLSGIGHYPGVDFQPIPRAERIGKHWPCDRCERDRADAPGGRSPNLRCPMKAGVRGSKGRCISLKRGMCHGTTLSALFYFFPIANLFICSSVHLAVNQAILVFARVSGCRWTIIRTQEPGRPENQWFRRARTSASRRPLCPTAPL